MLRMQGGGYVKNTGGQGYIKNTGWGGEGLY